MNAEKIKELRELVAAATPGPWSADGDGDINVGNYMISGWGCFYMANATSNAALAVAAVNSLPALLDEVEALKNELANYRHIGCVDHGKISELNLYVSPEDMPDGVELYYFDDAARHEPKDAE